MAMPRLTGGRSLTRLPSMTMSPRVRLSRPAIIRRSVDLPQPDGPDEDHELALAHVELHALDDLEGRRRLSERCQAQLSQNIVSNGRGAPA